MRVFIAVLVLIFSLQSWTKAGEINEIEIEVPQEITIDDILADPMSYALGLAEREFERHAPRFSEAFTLGQKLANDNMKGG